MDLQKQRSQRNFILTDFRRQLEPEDYVTVSTVRVTY